MVNGETEGKIHIQIVKTNSIILFVFKKPFIKRCSGFGRQFKVQRKSAFKLDTLREIAKRVGAFVKEKQEAGDRFTLLLLYDFADIRYFFRMFFGLES